MINQRIFIVCADPKAQGGVSSLIHAISLSGIYGKNSRFFYPYKVGNKVYKLINALMVWIKFMTWCVFIRPEFVHIHTSSYQSFKRKYLFVSLCRFFKIPYVLHLHGGSFIPFYQSSSRKWQRRISQSLMMAATVVTVSPQFRQELLKLFNIEDCRIIPNFGALVPLDNIDPEITKEKLSSLSLLFMGDIADYKGFEDAVLILMEVRKRFPSLTLNCAGKMDIVYFNNILQNHKATECVKYLGFISGNQKADILQKAVFFVSPSYVESFGLSNMEAASMGTPILAYAVGGVPSVITSGQSGYLADKNDWKSLAVKLCEIIGDEDAYYKLQASSVKDMKDKFSIPKITKLYHDLYR